MPPEPEETGGSSSARGGSSAGGASASGGNAGAGALGPDRTCDPSASTIGGVDVPSPLVSVGAEVFASSGVLNPERLTDGLYRSPSAGTNLGVPSEDEAPWVAIRIEPGPTKLLAMWSDAGFTDYLTTDGGAPIAYGIEVSADSEDGQDGSWEEAIMPVVDNPVRARAHSFDFADQAWVRLTVTEGPLDGQGMPRSVNLDELALYDISASEGGRPKDSWFFLGDSITKGAFQRDAGIQQFDALVNASLPEFTPIQISGGIGGELLTDGMRHIAMEEYLEINSDFEHVLIAYGTNDSWSDKNPGTFEANLRSIVQAVIDAGRVPVLPTIPYASVAHRTLPAWNEIVDRISAEFELPCGPDLYAWFRDHPSELNSDGIHPNEFGYRSMNQRWAESMLPLYPVSE